MRPPWPLLISVMHKTSEHSICVYYTVVSSHQFPIWDHGPLHLSIQHHGLFSPITYIRPGTTLSVYTTPWSLLTNPIHETSDHSICLYNIMVSSPQSHTWEQGPFYLSIQHRDLFSLIPCMRPGTTLSVYTTSWFLLTNPIHKNRGHSICLYNTMVSSHQLYSWDHGPLYPSMQHHDLFSPIPCHTWDQWPFYLSIHHHGLFSQSHT
jgi:hypothetical protein